MNPAQPLRPLRVLHVYGTYFPDPPGGLQEAIRQICLCVQPHGVQNTIFTLSPQPSPKVIDYPEARVVRCRSWAAPASCDLGGPASLATFRRLAHEADLIHYLYPWPFGDLLDLLAAPAKPKVLTYISDIVRQRWLGAAYAPLMWHTLRSMDAIVANAPAYAQTSPVLSTAAVRNKLHIIPLGLAESEQHHLDDSRILPKLGLAPGQPYLLFLGALRYYKGLPTLLQAAARVQAPIVIAGSGSALGDLRRQAQALGASNVHFAGQVTEAEKATLLRHCRALVLPSHLRSEAYGMVLIEASLFGKPMITCEIGTGTSFINLHGETGLVVAPGHAQELADAITLLWQDKTRAQQLGAAARRRYLASFSGLAMGRQYAALFRRLAVRGD